jgi:6-pyruvoyltetrahydropterin/6-carboxytetrahydropterin synthase
MKEEIRVRVYGGKNSFAASHFLVEMGKCERLHGHNYSVTVEVCGEPDSNGVVIDFNVLNPVVGEICNSLDHRVLIAKNDKRYKLSVGKSEVEVTFDDRRFVFPRKDCVILPVDATTVEKMSCFILGKIIKELNKGSNTTFKWIEVGVSEGSKQMALCRRDLI